MFESNLEVTNQTETVVGEIKVTNKKSKRGFATLWSERRKEIASQGGKISHVSGKGHEFSSEEAQVAGRIGGLKSRKAKQDSSKRESS